MRSTVRRHVDERKSRVVAESAIRFVLTAEKWLGTPVKAIQVVAMEGNKSLWNTASFVGEAAGTVH